MKINTYWRAKSCTQIYIYMLSCGDDLWNLENFYGF